MLLDCFVARKRKRDLFWTFYKSYQVLNNVCSWKWLQFDALLEWLDIKAFSPNCRLNLSKQYSPNYLKPFEQMCALQETHYYHNGNCDWNQKILDHVHVIRMLLDGLESWKRPIQSIVHCIWSTQICEVWKAWSLLHAKLHAISY